MILIFASYVFSAKAVVSAILETLSNNDYVAVLNYSKHTDVAVDCFKDILVQATPENLQIMMDKVGKAKTEEQSNLTEAFYTAFDLLKSYSETRGCGPTTPCNQLIMLVTDGVSGNLTEVRVH